MKNNITDKNSNVLSNAAYDISKGKIKEDKLIVQDKFKVLAVENNKDNGMQAMAVALVDSKIEIEIFKKLNNQIKRV